MRDDIAVTLSLAGRTRNPRRQSVTTRSGGFGGIPGLVHYLRDNAITAMIDATHPYAATMTLHAAGAAQESGTPFVVLNRPAWRESPGDLWTSVDDATAAVQAIGFEPRRVLLAIGRRDLGAFESAPQHHYLIRSVETVVPPLTVPRGAIRAARCCAFPPTRPGCRWPCRPRSSTTPRASRCAGAHRRDRRRDRRPPGVEGGNLALSNPNARANCHGRARDTGLYKAIVKPTLAAAVRRCSMTGHGFKLFDREIAQKSWPNGAPTRAATANMQVMPGTTVTSRSRQIAGPRSRASHTAAAIANTPGVASGDHGDERAGRSVLQRPRGPIQLLAIIGGLPALVGAHRQPRHVRSIAVEHVRAIEGDGGLGRELIGVSRPETDDRDSTAHACHARPAINTMAK